MNKRLFLTATLCLSGLALSVSAQTGTDEFLQRVAQSSVYVDAGRQEADARIIATRAENRPANPEAEYAYMPGIEDTEARRISYGLTQSIAWPGEYIAQSKYNKLERQQAEVEFSGQKQAALLRAKLLCYELVFAQKRQDLLNEQQANAENTLALIQKQFTLGQATALDLNNAKLNLATTNTAWQEGKARIETLRQQLALVAGFSDFDPEAFTYIENPGENLSELYAEACAANPAIRAARLESEKSARNVSVQRSSTLPSISVGVAGERISSHDSFMGIKTGLSIPLWGGANKVKAAKAQQAAAALRSETIRIDEESALTEQVNTIRQLQESLKNYESMREIHEGKSLLNKSLEQQNISMINYLTSLDYYYQIQEEYLNLELRLHQALAELTKFRL